MFVEGMRLSDVLSYFRKNELEDISTKIAVHRFYSYRSFVVERRKVFLNTYVQWKVMRLGFSRSM